MKVAKVYKDAKLPLAATEGSAALDLYAYHNTVLYPRQTESIGTGIAVEIPYKYCGLVLPRSGLAAKEGITVLNAPGLIDSDYRGEIKVILHNTTDFIRDIKKDQRIAQLLISPLSTPEEYEIIEIEELTNTERGSDGLGSTGKN